MDKNPNADDAVTVARPAAPHGEQPGELGLPPKPDAPSPTGHPPAIWFFFWGEFAERSSYYGMRTILMLYLTTTLHMTAGVAGPIYSAFKTACYLLPLLGGFIADRWLGRYWTIVGFSVPYIAGHFILGIPMEPPCSSRWACWPAAAA